MSDRKSYIVRQYDKDGSLVREYNSYQEASEATGVKIICIQQTCYGKKRSAGGYLWRKGSREELPLKLPPLEEPQTSYIAKPVKQCSKKGYFATFFFAKTVIRIA